jgi:hypothetical protein
MGTRNTQPAVAAVAVLVALTWAQDVRGQAGPEPNRRTVAEADGWRSEAFPPVPAVVARATEARSGMRFSWSDVAHTVGGALVGGWLGYVGSQVVHSDWDKEANGAFRSQRSLWSAAGALLGIAGSQALGGTAPAAVVTERPTIDGARRVITEQEIRESSAGNAYDLVAVLRPEWLVTRGTHSVSETARGEGAGRQLRARPGAPKLIVYLEDVRLGDVDRMRSVVAESLTRVRFLDSREATLRYGMGHTHGAILLSTGVPAP